MIIREIILSIKINKLDLRLCSAQVCLYFGLTQTYGGRGPEGVGGLNWGGGIDTHFVPIASTLFLFHCQGLSFCSLDMGIGFFVQVRGGGSLTPLFYFINLFIRLKLGYPENFSLLGAREVL